MVKTKLNGSMAVYPGTFDPITYGHIDIIMRASSIFENVLVTVADNPNKKPVFSMEERVAFVKDVVEKNGMDNVEIDSFTGLLVDYLKEKKASIIIRGLRVFTDFDQEFAFALMNKKLYSEIETILLMTNEKYSFISSSLIKEVAKLGGNIEAYVPEMVVKAFNERFN